MKATNLPDDMWRLVADWSAWPSLSLVDRRRWWLLRHRHVLDLRLVSSLVFRLC